MKKELEKLEHTKKENNDSIYLNSVQKKMTREKKSEVQNKKETYIND